MNSDTIVVYNGGSTRNTILPLALASITETEFKIGRDDGGTSTIAVLSVPLQTAIVGASNPNAPEANSSKLVDMLGMEQDFRGLRGRPYFTTSSFDCRPFLIRLTGFVTPASNVGNTYTIKVYGGTSKAGTALATTGAVAVATTTANFGFDMEVQCIWSLSAGNLRGWFQFEADGTTPGHGNQAALSSNFAAAAATNLQFCATVTWGNAVGGTATVQEFAIDRK